MMLDLCALLRRDGRTPGERRPAVPEAPVDLAAAGVGEITAALTALRGREAALRAALREQQQTEVGNE